MKIITQTPGPGGAYPPIQECGFFSLPPGMALWPDEMPTATFYEYSGFVTLDIQEAEGIPVVMGCQPNTEAWEAWKASQPEEPDTEPEPESDMDLMAAAYREGVSEA